MNATLDNLLSKLSEADRAEVDLRADRHLQAIRQAKRLDDVRKALGQTQEQLAAKLRVGQNAVSQLEKRRDLRISTLGRYVKSLGFELELALLTPNGERVPLDAFRPWQEERPNRAKAPSAKRTDKARPQATESRRQGPGSVQKAVKAASKERAAASSGRASRHG